MARGFEEDMVVQRDSPTVGKGAMRIFIGITASKGWRIKTTDIKSAFLQGRELDREVFLKPPHEAKVQSGKVWRLKRCLYGLNDAARQFCHSVVELLVKLGCLQSTFDPALFFLRKNDTLVGIIACHIDDFLHAGDVTFEPKLDKLRERFLAGKLEEGKFRYVGFHLSQQEHSIMIDQSDYVEDIDYAKVPPQRALLKASELTDEEHRVAGSSGADELGVTGHTSRSSFRRD